MQSIWDISNDKDKEGANADFDSLDKPKIYYSDFEKPIVPAKSFEELALHNTILEMLYGMCLFSPCKVQSYVLPFMLKGNTDRYDVVIHAEKKSGKTSTVLLAVFNHLSLSGNKYSRAMVVCPTLELVRATYNMVQNFAKYNKTISVRMCIRKDRCKKGTKIDEKIIIGTPEKICSIINEGIIDKSNIEMIVFDDIQCMLNGKGHENSIFKIVRFIPTASQLIFISSAVSAEQTKECLKGIITCKKFCPFSVEFPMTECHTPSNMQYFIASDKKQDLLKFIICVRAFGQIVIVCSSRETVTDVHGYLKQITNFRIDYLFGRLKNTVAVIEDFKSRKIKILVTTPSFTNLRTSALVTLINYDQFLINEPPRFELDMEKYNKWIDVVADRKESIIINFVKKRDALYLFAKEKCGNLQIVDEETVDNQNTPFEQ